MAGNKNRRPPWGEMSPQDFYRTQEPSDYEEKRSEQLAQFEAIEPLRNLSRLIVPEITKARINTVLAKIRHHKTLYEDWNLRSLDPYGSRTAINLYGPPGTGKSFCAEAIAAELKKKFIRVNYAELESKYVGQTSKNIQAAFAAARATNALLFFDEADSILGRRLTSVTQSADSSVNISRSVMLMELDRFEGITVFATNLFRNYDGAFIRRIPDHIEMPLPDQVCRKRLWDLHLLPTIPGAATLDRAALAAQSEGLSGGDILNIVVSAASMAVTRPHEKQVITLADIVEAMAVTRKARVEAGQEKPLQAITTTTKIPLSEVPPEIQALAQERRNGTYTDTNSLA